MGLIIIFMNSFMELGSTSLVIDLAQNQSSFLSIINRKTLALVVSWCCLHESFAYSR